MRLYVDDVINHNCEITGIPRINAPQIDTSARLTKQADKRGRGSESDNRGKITKLRLSIAFKHLIMAIFSSE